MMRLADRRRRTRDADIVPMINVAFLLLVFLLMTAVLAPPEPADIEPPVADLAPEDRRDDTLYVTSNGMPLFRDARGSAALAMLPGGTLRVKADRALPGVELSRLLSALADAGVAEVELVTAAP